MNPTISDQLRDLHHACRLAMELSADARAFPEKRDANLRALAIQADGIRMMANRANAPENVRRALKGL